MSLEATDANSIFHMLQNVNFDEARSQEHLSGWASGDGLNAYMNRALRDASGEQVAHYIGPNNFSFNSAEGILDAAKHLCRRVVEEEELNDHYGSDGLTKPFVFISNNQTVLAQHPAAAGDSGGEHWVAWVLLPKHYRNLEGEESSIDHYRLFFFDSLAFYEFPNHLRRMLVEGGAFQQVTEEGEEHQMILQPFCSEAEIDFISCHDLTGQQRGMLGGDCGWWAVYYALMAVYTGDTHFLEPLKKKHLRATALRQAIDLQAIEPPQELMVEEAAPSADAGAETELKRLFSEGDEDRIIAYLRAERLDTLSLGHFVLDQDKVRLLKSVLRRCQKIQTVDLSHCNLAGKLWAFFDREVRSKYPNIEFRLKGNPAAAAITNLARRQRGIGDTLLFDKQLTEKINLVAQYIRDLNLFGEEAIVGRESYQINIREKDLKTFFYSLGWEQSTFDRVVQRSFTKEGLREEIARSPQSAEHIRQRIAERIDRVQDAVIVEARQAFQWLRAFYHNQNRSDKYQQFNNDDVQNNFGLTLYNLVMDFLSLRIPVPDNPIVIGGSAHPQLQRRSFTDLTKEFFKGFFYDGVLGVPKLVWSVGKGAYYLATSSEVRTQVGRSLVSFARDPVSGVVDGAQAVVRGIYENPARALGGVAGSMATGYAASKFFRGPPPPDGGGPGGVAAITESSKPLAITSGEVAQNIAAPPPIAAAPATIIAPANTAPSIPAVGQGLSAPSKFASKFASDLKIVNSASQKRFMLQGVAFSEPSGVAVVDQVKMAASKSMGTSIFSGAGGGGLAEVAEAATGAAQAAEVGVLAAPAVEVAALAAPAAEVAAFAGGSVVVTPARAISVALSGELVAGENSREGAAVEENQVVLDLDAWRYDARDYDIKDYSEECDISFFTNAEDSNRETMTVLADDVVLSSRQVSQLSFLAQVSDSSRMLGSGSSASFMIPPPSDDKKFR